MLAHMQKLPLAPRRPAYGTTARRIGWDGLPPGVRAAISGRVGARPQAEASAGSGFTSGFAARVSGESGCWFVKAAGAREAPFAAASYLVEARINPLLPAAVPAPRLRWTEQTEEEWVVLGFDAVVARMPRLPWRADELDAVLHAYAVTAEALTPAPEALVAAGLQKIADLESDFEFWRKVAGGAVDASVLPDFVPHEWIDPLAELESSWRTAAAGESVLHNDLRADNVLISDEGAATFCDWNWATYGPSWLDLTVLLADAAADGHDASTLLTKHRAADGAAAEHIDSVLAGIAGFFVGRGSEPDEALSPHLRAHQRYCAHAVLSWLAERRKELKIA